MDTNLENLHGLKELSDCIEKIKQIDDQRKAPTRDGMIKALAEAQSIAFIEIAAAQIPQGASYKPWKDFTDEALYNMLLPYRQGLCQHCIIKFGEKAFEQALKAAQN